MRVLWVSPTSTAKHRGGGGTYSRAILDLLRDLRDCELVELEPARIPTRLEHRLRQLRSLGMAALRAESAKLLFDRDPELRARLRSALRSPTSLVVFNGTSVAAEADLVPDDVPVLVIVHNLEADLYAEQLGRLPPPLRLLTRDLLGQARRHQAHELRVFARSSALIFVSEDDARRARTMIARDVPSLVVPPIFSGACATHRKRQRQPEERIRLGFVAKMGWWPNREALSWFLEEVWPRVDRTRVELHLFGESSEASAQPDQAVFGHGYVTDAADIWSSIDVFVNPMQSGGGVNVKVCEALFHGLPVLSTPHGLRGLPTFADPALRVCENQSRWLESLAPENLERFSLQAPQVETSFYFSSQRVAPELADFVRSLLRTSQP